MHLDVTHSLLPRDIVDWCARLLLVDVENFIALSTLASPLTSIQWLVRYYITADIIYIHLFISDFGLQHNTTNVFRLGMKMVRYKMLYNVTPMCHRVKIFL